MTKWTLRFVVAFCACLLASASVYAHHSLAGVYSLGKESKITGAFKAFRLVNPHSALRLDVKGSDGKSPVGLLVAITYPDGHTVRFRSPDE